ncbi:MLP-like protein 328 [Linum perenne]
MGGKVEAEVELKAPPAKFFNVFRKAAHHIPTHTPSNIQAVDCHHGDWESHDGIKIWNYTCEGKAEVFKERVEFDEPNRIIKLNGLEGDVMKIYKVFNPIFELVSSEKGDGGVAKLSIEYEKMDPSFPAPTKYLDFMISLTKDTDDGLVKSEGKPEVFKERVEFDEQKKIMKATGLEGDPMKIYKVFNVVYEFVSKSGGGGGGGGVAKLAIEYEKVDPSSPPPTKYMDFLISLTKETDAALVKSG